MKQYVLKLKSFIADNERVLMPGFLLLGFVVDGLTLRQVDFLPETVLVYAYLSLSAWAILVMHLIRSGVFKGKLANRLEPVLPLILTYVFGSLFSAFAIFYSKSALIVDSWPFIAVLVAVVVGLEIFKRYRDRLVFNLSIFFLAIFSFTIFSVPLWVGALGTEVFLLSGITAVVIFTLFCVSMYAAGKQEFIQNLKGIAYSVVTILTVVIVLYTTNLLPPIPLVLRDVGVYHYIAKDNGAYRLLGEPVSLFDRLFGITIHWVKGEPVYVFSSVYTPVAIDTDVVHQWEYWSTLEEKWVFSNTVSFPAEGGRTEGYRGYSWKRGVFPGKWRVTVETPDGLKIGRIEFTIEEVVQVPQLVIGIR